jgi:ubiquinone/menaquinone biosynthesis C-methylase UbiE
MCEPPVSWEIFEEAAARYEPWYATPRGRRADRAECALLGWLLGWFPDVQRVLEIGCGTGHFTRWLAARARVAIGLDRSPAMLREARTLMDDTPLLLADAYLNRPGFSGDSIT